MIVAKPKTKFFTTSLVVKPDNKNQPKITLFFQLKKELKN
jgi:hypothetical protein